MDLNKYQNLKQILEGRQEPDNPTEKRIQYKDHRQNKKVYLFTSDVKHYKYDQDQEIGEQQKVEVQPKQKNIKGISSEMLFSSSKKSSQEQSSPIQIGDSNDDTTYKQNISNNIKQRNIQAKYQYFMKGSNPQSTKNNHLFLTPQKSETSRKAKLSNDLQSSNSQRQLSVPLNIRKGQSIGMLNSTGGGSSNHNINSQNNLTETMNLSNQSPIKLSNQSSIKLSNQSPIKLNFQDKLKIQKPQQSQKQASSLRNIPSPLEFKEGLNKLLTPRDYMETSGKRYAAAFLTCKTQRDNTNDICSESNQLYNNPSLVKIGSMKKGSYDTIQSAHTLSQPFITGKNKKGQKCFTAVNTFNNLPSTTMTNISEQTMRDEMNENFRATLNLIDLNDMKKNTFKDSSTTIIKPLVPKKIDKLVIYKPNTSSLDQVLAIGKTNLLQLGVNDFTYFCIRVKGEQSPLRVRINQDKMLNYKIMVSKEYPTPSQFNCDYNLQGSVFSFECDNISGYFTTQEYFYFAIYSNDEAIIRLHIGFGSDLDSFKYQKQQNNNPQQQTQNGQVVPKQEFKLSCADMSNQQLSEEVKQILERRKKKMGATEQDLIQKNMEDIKSDNVLELKQKKQQFLELKKLKIQQAQEQKLYRFENHLNQLTQLKEERENKKQENAIQQLIDIKKFQKKTFDFIWITNIVMILATKKLANKLQKHKQRQRLMRDMAFSLLRPFFRYKTRARKIGGLNIDLRVLLEAKYVVNSYVQVKKKKVKVEAKKALISCLRQNAQRHNNVQKVLGFIYSCRKIVEKFQCFHYRIIYYKKLLFRYWEKYFYDVIDEIFDVKLDIASQKNPSLAKRFIQNVQSSFNHIDHKRNAIDNFYKKNLQNYREKVKEVYMKNKTPINNDNKHKLRKQKTFMEQLKQRIIFEQAELPRIFITPTREQFKEIIYEAAKAISNQYAELQKKVVFKY